MLKLLMNTIISKEEGELGARTEKSQISTRTKKCARIKFSFHKHIVFQKKYAFSVLKAQLINYNEERPLGSEFSKGILCVLVKIKVRLVSQE